MFDLKEERRYRQLRKLAQELHIPLPEAFLTLEVFDKDGNLIRKQHQRSHSWTRNAYNMLFCQLAGKDADDALFEAGKLSSKDTAGAVYSGNGPYMITAKGDYSCDLAGGLNGGYRALAGNDGNGILVGSGENAENFEDYVLQTPIAEGAGVGELNHAQSEEHSISYTDTTLKNELVRYFNNNSGGNIGVKEVALVAYAGKPGAVAYAKCLHSRDKLPATVTVPDTGQLKVTYTIQLTYSA